MKEILIEFVDFWNGFDRIENFIYKTLSKKFKIKFSNKPDYLFYSSYGFEHLNYSNCIKIFYTGENQVPDFNLCDYGIGFHYLDFKERYLRLPLCFIRSSYDKVKKEKKINKEEVLNRRFCNFVYSNNLNADPIRRVFLEKLSEYKKVDSGGKYLNNGFDIGESIEDKLVFLGNYKFTIAIENSAVEGYTTEKIIEPMSVNSIPIYWGNPLIKLDFNEKSFIHLSNKTEEEIKKVIERIIYLDNNDEEYLKVLQEPWQTPKQVIQPEEVLLAFLNNIISQPINKARKRPNFGYARNYEISLRKKIFDEPLNSDKELSTKFIVHSVLKKIIKKFKRTFITILKKHLGE